MVRALKMNVAALGPHMALALALSLALAPGNLHAGAWEREPGTFFVSLYYNLPTDSEDYDVGTVSAYVEYGLPWRLTAGANLDQRPIGPHSLELFLRRNFNAPDAMWQVAVEAGFEMALDAHIDEYTGQISYLTEPGQPAVALHLGRGFSNWLVDGWLDVRFGANLPTADADLRGEIDATIGWNLTDRVFGTFELWHDFNREDSVTSLVPGVGVRVTDRISANLRYIHERNERVVDSVEIGTWLEF